MIPLACSKLGAFDGPPQQRQSLLGLGLRNNNYNDNNNATQQIRCVSGASYSKRLMKRRKKRRLENKSKKRTADAELRAALSGEDAIDTSSLRGEIALAKQDIFGTLPNLNIGPTGNQRAKKQFTGVEINRYYLESINKAANKVIPGWLSEQQERRLEKLKRLRARGAGPPKKGAGSRKSKRK